MRRSISVIAVTTAVFAGMGQLAIAAPQQDQVSGRGASAVFDARVNARSGPQGEKPRGTFTTDFVNQSVQDRQVMVSCLVVIRNTAVVGGLDRTGTETFLKIHDNGDAGDLTGFSTALQGVPEPDQQRCAQMFDGIGNLVLPVDGVFTVVDS